jgi:protein-S-isoprenylcysteine O-methyltransferase Ste14
LWAKIRPSAPNAVPAWPAEDRWLKEKFGAQYDEYRKRVLVKFF